MFRYDVENIIKPVNLQKKKQFNSSSRPKLI